MLLLLKSKLNPCVMKRKAVFDLGMPIPQKIQRTQDIIDKMGLNVTTFPNPTPPLVDVQTAKDNLEKAYTIALDGSRTAKSEQRQKNTELDNALRPLRDYVNEVAMGDEVTVLKSGFAISKLPAPVGAMPTVTIRSGLGAHGEGNNGDGSGSIKLRWNPVYGAKNYVVQQSMDGVNFEPVLYPTRASALVTKLVVGQFYWFRVAANGADGLGNFGPAMKVLAS